METLTLLFWIFFAIIFYTYLGYGILLYAMVLIKEFFIKPRTITLPDPLPEVTLFIPAYNEASVIKEKMENCQKLDYPSGKLKILWITDGSNDASNKTLAGYPGIEIQHDPQRKGKTAAMNRGMQFVKTPLVIFSDANTLLNKEAIMEMIRKFSDPGVGCVAGEKRIRMTEEADAVSSGEGIYWKYESTLKKLDGRLYSVTGAAGELFGIRAALFSPIPEDTLLDDFIFSLRLVMKGYRTAYCPEAYALEWSSSDMAEEEKRKVRIAAGGLQSIVRLAPLLNPFKYGIFSFQYISHRVLRWTITPVLFFLLLPLNFILVFQKDGGWIFPVILIGQVLFYGAATAGKLLANRNLKIKALFIPYYFIFMNLSVLKGLVYLSRNKKKGGIWSKAKRKEESGNI